MKLFNKAILCFFLFYGCSNHNHSNINTAKLNEIDTLIKSFIDNNQIPGAVVLVGNNEKIMFMKSISHHLGLILVGCRSGMVFIMLMQISFIVL